MTQKKRPCDNWLPAKGEKYYYILPTGKIEEALWDGWILDRTRRESFNIFRSKEEAESLKARHNAWTSPKMDISSKRYRNITLQQYNEAVIWLHKNPNEYRPLDQLISKEDYRERWALFQEVVRIFKKENNF